jgi:DNA-binding NarL/FixJ family response regulator
VRTYLIEPQTIFVPYLSRVLENGGFEVIATSAGVDSSDIAAHNPAAILVDVDFLERGGPTALCRIRDAARSAALVALSDRTDPLFAATCVISGASAVCSKSEGEDKILRALRRALQQQQDAFSVGR